MTRISTAQLFSNTLATLREKQSRLVEIQSALASGKKINQASDDPVGASRVLEARALNTRIEQYAKNMDTAEARLIQEESILASAGENLNRARELIVASVNAINDSEDLKIYGVEIQALLGDMLGLANTRDANGEFIFAGTASDIQPFGFSPTGSFAYFGNTDRRDANISDNRTVAMTDPGSAIFFDLLVGNGDFQANANPANTGTGIVGESSVFDPAAWTPDTYTVTFLDPDNYEVRDSGGGLVTTGVYQDPARISFSGAEFELTGTPDAGDVFTVTPRSTQDIFTTYQDLSTALSTSVGLTDAARTNLIYRALENIDQALIVNQNTRADIGSRLQQIDDYRDLNERQQVQAAELVSRIEDLDYAQAISDFELQSTTLEAAQKTFLALQDLSLFRLLR
ncbi:MAG: flagellar hook-associated protein FlgL [Xanthomonadales bacterium]|nr:flagellar hook-associated protein FlgL [Xanthomonadales bacterium]